jgi:hypothetical protein
MPQSKARYIATLADLDDPSKTYCEGAIWALTDDEAMAEAERWAWAECGKRGYENAGVVVAGGTIKGTHTKKIDLTS